MTVKKPTEVEKMDEYAGLRTPASDAMKEIAELALILSPKERDIQTWVKNKSQYALGYGHCAHPSMVSIKLYRIGRDLYAARTWDIATRIRPVQRLEWTVRKYYDDDPYVRAMIETRQLSQDECDKIAFRYEPSAECLDILRYMAGFTCELSKDKEISEL